MVPFLVHCDDKRTAAALKHNIIESEAEIAELSRQLKGADAAEAGRIQDEIAELERFLDENRAQLGD